MHTFERLGLDTEYLFIRKDLLRKIFCEYYTIIAFWLGHNIFLILTEDKVSFIKICIDWYEKVLIIYDNKSKTNSIQEINSKIFVWKCI